MTNGGRERGWGRGLTALMPRSLAGRLALTFVGVVVAVNIVLGVFISRSVDDFYIVRLQTQLLNESRLISRVIGDEPATVTTPNQLDELAAELASLVEARVTIVARDGTVLGDSAAQAATMENHAQRPEIVTALRGEVGVSSRWSETLGATYYYVAQAPSATAPVVRVAVATTNIEAAVAAIERGARLGAAAAALIVGAAGVFVARRIAEPLARLRQQANAIAGGQYDVQVEPAATLELGEVGRAFNLMTNQVRASLTEAEAARARLLITITNLSDGVVVTDARGTVVQINPAAVAMLGVDSEATGLPFVQISRDHDLANLLNAALATPGLRRGVVEYVRTRRYLEATAQRIASPSERLAVIVLRDITELRKLEGVRREFVANVSHELRTPLASIRALVETLEAGAVNEPEVAGDFFRRIINEVERLAALVDELLDLARLESGRITLTREALPTAAVLGEAVERLRPQVARASLTLQTDLPAALPPVLGDRARIEQVMLNLVHNAIKFTAAGGRITVSATARPNQVVITVADTGIGIPAEDLPRVFERFYKADRARSTGGTGLGLAISKHIVQALGGEISVTSASGRGAKFSFSLPRADVTPAGHAIESGSNHR